MVKTYRKSSHSVFRIELHIVWVTKYRYNVLTKDVATRTRNLIRQIAIKYDVEIISGVVSKDHVHLLISIDPKIAIADILQNFKGTTSRKLQQEFPHLKKRYWGQHFWARGYFAVSTGNVSTDMITEYIQHHFEKKETTKDMFTIDQP